MRAKAPLDVDLEDKLLYGLTPMRLAYLVVGLLSGVTLWSSSWAPEPLPAVACVAVVAIGGSAAWGRWRGRPVDAWIADIATFVVRTRRVVLNECWIQRFKRFRLGRASTPRLQSPISIVVAGRKPKAGATTVAVEVAACLAIKGYSDELWWVSSANVGNDHKPSASEPLLSVVAADAARVCYLDWGAGPLLAGLIPEDNSVQLAAALNQATVVAFPDAPASRAFRELVEVIAAPG
jgi:hypothetical protein